MTRLSDSPIPLWKRLLVWVYVAETIVEVLFFGGWWVVLFVVFFVVWAKIERRSARRDADSSPTI